MSADIESLGLLFELQWKKKPGGNNREDVASIGIWDTPNASLDLVTFKSYVCQNLGTLEDIYVAYIDSDGDELPIESECEFQEALKFARQRASQGREVVLKVEKCEGPPSTSQPAASAQKAFTVSKLMTDAERDMKKKHVKSNGKSVSKMKSGDKIRTGMTQPSTEEGRVKSEASGISNEIGKKLACIMKSETEKRKRTKTEKDDSPPSWFKKYMQEFKSEIVAEITTNVMYNTRQVLESAKVNSRLSSCCSERNGGLVAVNKPRKKKTSDEDSDGALSGDQRDHKLLKKIEKLHKREKKLEKKLDSKLEKLENKTKRRMEKKIQSRSCSEQPSEKKTCSGAGKRTKDWPVGTYLMDAVPLNDGPKPAETHIRLGGRFTKAWEIMNSGTLPWTDKTELRLAWGSYGLEPKATVVKCPLLMPGEKGVIAVTFRAPEFPGRFESYWHFYHMGVRFGHWLDCAVIVDAKETEKQEVANERPLSSNVSVDWHESVCDEKGNEDTEMSKAKVDQPVDLRKKYEPNQEASSADVKSVVVMGNVCDKMNDDKRTSVDGEKTGTKQRNAEYESDSDDENISVISGTISLTSDSEEDETFVHVPMPVCFTYDCPVQKSDSVPAAVKECLEKSQNWNPEVQFDPEKNLHHTLSSNVGDAPCTLNTGLGATGDGKKCDFEVEDRPLPEMSKETSSHEDPVSHERCEHVVYSKSEVYAVDMAGHCMPVDSAWASHNNNHCNYALFGNSKIYDHSSKSSSLIDSDTPSSKGKRDDIKHDQSSGKNSSFHTTAHSHTTTGPFNLSFSVGETVRDGQTFGTSFIYKTTPSANKTQNGFRQCETPTSSNTTQGPSPDQTQFATSFNYTTSSSTATTQNGIKEHEGQKPSSNTAQPSFTNQPQFGTSFNYSTSSSKNGTQNGFEQHKGRTPSANTSQASSPNLPEDLFGAAVHILPETLVSSAVNVASHAYTTARSVLNNLRFRPSEEHAAWNWNDSAANWSVQPDMSTTECLEILVEMGFTNANLNVLLLQRYDNDIAKVVAELLT